MPGMDLSKAPESTSVRDRAIYHAPTKAFSRNIPAVPAHIFAAEREQAYADGQPTGYIVMNLQRELDTETEATTPFLLARYLVINPGETFANEVNCTAELYYVLEGNGRTASAGETFSWEKGDCFCLPGGSRNIHRAGEGKVILVMFTNEPELAYGGHKAPAADESRIAPTLFQGAVTSQHLSEVHGRNGPQLAAGKSVVFVTEAMKRMLVSSPTMLSAINTLEPGGDQRAHRHSSVALTLAIEGEGVYSMVGDRRIDWVDGAVIVTPPGSVHSHHNRGRRMMKSYVVQDTGLHSHLRTTNFAWTEEERM